MTKSSASEYVLGTAETEHDRLMRQASLLAPYTERLFRDAGVVAGQRVLDIGSGVGDVALLAAQIVGPGGQVVGIDLDGTALARARKRAEACGLPNVVFVETDLARFISEEPFDAIVGRLVLQFVAKPIQIMNALASVLRAGGVMVFQESNWEALLSQVAHLPLRRSCCELIYESFKRSNANMEMASIFLRGFQEIRLPQPQMRLDVPIGVEGEIRRWVYDLVSTLYPRFVQYGLSVTPLGDLATLSERLDLELTSNCLYGACIGLTGAWSRKPTS